VRGRGRAWLPAAGSAVAFAAAFYLRLNAAYGPFNLSWHPTDWTVLWELMGHGQIAPRILVQGALLGAAVAAVPWVIFALRTRRRGTS
jgi:hypothetical protein